MRTFLFSLLFLNIGFFNLPQVRSQNIQDSTLRLKNGVGFYPSDKSFSMNIHFRIQSRVGLTSTSDKDFTISETEAQVKRMRLKLDGFIINQKLTYLFHLGFTRYDMDWDKTSYPGIIRDALVSYRFNKNFQLSFGQAKLPGSRQKVISSGSQQFIDRSVTSNTYGSDRDFGIFVNSNFDISKTILNLKGAITTGDGRNAGNTNNGYAYSGRVEFLPFGSFTAYGDYFEGDLKREEKPKLSLGAAYSYNEKALKSGGQYGNLLYSPVNIASYYYDLVFKYHGFALSSEYISRETNSDTYTVNSSNDSSYVNTGNGYFFQGSYIFKKNWEIAGRYSTVNPDPEIGKKEPKIEYYTIGVNRYLSGHKVKLQANCSYKNQEYLNNTIPASAKWILQFQVELGF